MKLIEDDPDWHLPVVELTERNLLTLLAKLKDPNSARTLFDGEWKIGVRAVSDDQHYKTRAPGFVLHVIEIDPEGG